MITREEYLRALDIIKQYQRQCSDFGDGWGANVRMEAINSLEARMRRKVSSGFCGYEWMIDSIIKNNKIIA
jgi:hypothetical protein